MTEKTKEHRLITLQDLIDVATDDNFDTLMIDLKNWLGLQLGLKKVNASQGLGFSVRVNGKAVLKWMDDGKNNINIKISVE